MPGPVDATAVLRHVVPHCPTDPGAVSVPSVAPPAVLALVLVTAGVVVVPIRRVPGSLVSLAGVYLYWFHTGYAKPSVPLLVGLTAVGVAAFAGETFRSVAADSVSGPSTISALAAGVVGLTLFAFVGPGVALLGVLGTVFLLEYRRSKRLGAASVAALTVVLSTVASNAVRLLLAGAIWTAVVALVLF